MAAGAMAQGARRKVVDEIPHRQHQVVVLLHREHPVRAGRDLRRVTEIDPWNGPPPQHVGDVRRMHRRADAVPGYVQHEARECRVVQILIAERVAAQLRRWHEPPVREHRPGLDPPRQNRAHIIRRTAQVGGEFLLLRDLPRIAPFISDRERAERQRHPVRQPDRLLHALTFDKCAVGRVQIGQHGPFALEIDAAMAAGDIGRLDRDAAGPPDDRSLRTDRQTTLNAVVQEGQKVPDDNSLRPRHRGAPGDRPFTFVFFVAIRHRSPQCHETVIVIRADRDVFTPSESALP